jgi:hypothetical protein
MRKLELHIKLKKNRSDGFRIETFHLLRVRGWFFCVSTEQKNINGGVHK